MEKRGMYMYRGKKKQMEKRGICIGEKLLKKKKKNVRSILKLYLIASLLHRILQLVSDFYQY